MRASYGAPILYTVYWAQGKHTKIPDSGVMSDEIAECPNGNFGYNNTSYTGFYTFWVVGAVNSYDGKKTDPSNLVVLDFGE